MSTNEKKDETIEETIKEKDKRILKDIYQIICQQPGGNRNKRRIKQYGGVICPAFKIGNWRENRIVPIIAQNTTENIQVQPKNIDAIISNIEQLSTLELLPVNLWHEISKYLKPIDINSLFQVSQNVNTSISHICIPVQLFQNTKFKDYDIIRCISDIITMFFNTIRQSYSEMSPLLKLFFKRLKLYKIVIGNCEISCNINIENGNQISNIWFKTPDANTTSLNVVEDLSKTISEQVFKFVNTIDIKTCLSKCSNEELKMFFDKYDYYIERNSDKIKIDEILEMRGIFNEFKTTNPGNIISTPELKFGLVNINIPKELYDSLTKLGIQEVSYDDLIGVLTYYKRGNPTQNTKTMSYFKNLVKIKIEKNFDVNYKTIDTRFKLILQEKGDDVELILVKFSIISIVKSIVALSQKIKNVSVFDRKIFRVILHIFSYLNILKNVVDKSNISETIRRIHSIIDGIGSSYNKSASQLPVGFTEDIDKILNIIATETKCLSELKQFIGEINTEIISQFSPKADAFWNSLVISEVYTFLNKTNEDDLRIMRFFDEHGRIKNNDDLFIFLKEKYINILLGSLTSVTTIKPEVAENITNPNKGFEEFVTESINFTNVNELFDGLFPPPGGGSRPTKQLKKTDSRIKYQGRTRIVYVGKRGGKYIKIKGDMVSLSYILRKDRKS